MAPRAGTAPALDPGPTLGTDAARLLVALARVIRAVRRDAPVGEIGPGALGALTTLVREGPLRLGALAAHEGVSAPSMTRIVGSLVDADLARRTPDPEDGRASLLEPTRAGQDLVGAGRSDRLAALTTRIERLDGEQRRALAAVIPTLEAIAAD